MHTQFLHRPGGRIAFDDTGGPGPLVICVPSMGDLRHEYRWLRPVLQRAGYRVVTMDLRGLGESSTGWPDHSPAALGSDIIALARHLDAGPAAVVGTSLAAAAAVWAAAEAPNHISHLALVGPFVRDLPLSPVQRIGLAVMLRGPWRVAAWVAYYRSLYRTAPPPDLPAYLQRLRANLSEPGRFDAMLAMGSASKAESARRLAAVAAPALVIMGTRDPDFRDPAAEAGWIAAQLRGRALMVEGAGHYPHAELPEQVGAALIAFFRSGSGSHVA